MTPPTVATKTNNKRQWHKQARGRVPNPTDFGITLYSSISNINLSANEFARRVGMSSGFISGVYSGLKKPPLDRLDKWVKVLKLVGDQRDVFILKAHLEHATPLMRQLFSKYRDLAIEACDKGIMIRGLNIQPLLLLKQ